MQFVVPEMSFGLVRFLSGHRSRVINSWFVTRADCFHHLQTIRLKQTVEKARESARKSPERDGDHDGAAQGKFIHFSCLTLPHFMALVSRPNAKAIPGGVALCVVSGLSSLINSSLPKNTEDNAGAKSTKGAQITLAVQTSPPR